MQASSHSLKPAQLKKMIDAGLQAAGSQLVAELEDEGVYIRDLCLSLSGSEILCETVSETGITPRFRLPISASAEAAVRIVLLAIHPIIERAVEEARIGA